MARATLGDKSVVPWEWLVEDYSRIRDKIEAVFPIFQGFNARIKVPGGFRLANAASERIWVLPLSLHDPICGYSERKGNPGRAEANFDLD